MEEVRVFLVFCHTCGKQQMLYLPFDSRRTEPDLPED